MNYNRDKNKEFECYPKGRNHICERVSMPNRNITFDVSYSTHIERPIRVSKRKKINPFRKLTSIEGGNTYIASMLTPKVKDNLNKRKIGSVLYTHILSSEKANIFKINEYITLKFEDGNSNIYVGGELFNQCKYLLIEINTNEIEKYDYIGSIDEAAETLGNDLEGTESDDVRLIDPQSEFWGHCSNLQAWAENNYDTRLIHRNLAFPLLKALVRAGDPKAKRIFKDEIAMRLNSLYLPVIVYLIEESYLDFLNKDEIHSVITPKQENEFYDGIFEERGMLYNALDADLQVKFLKYFNRGELSHLKVRLKREYYEEYHVKFEEVPFIILVRNIINENRRTRLPKDLKPNAKDLPVYGSFKEYATYNIEEIKEFRGFEKVNYYIELEGKFYCVNQNGNIIGLSLRSMDIGPYRISQILMYIELVPHLKYLNLENLLSIKISDSDDDVSELMGRVKMLEEYSRKNGIEFIWGLQ